MSNEMKSLLPFTSFRTRSRTLSKPSVVSNWMKKHDLPLESSVRAELDSGIYRLIESSLRAFT